MEGLRSFGECLRNLHKAFYTKTYLYINIYIFIYPTFRIIHVQSSLCGPDFLYLVEEIIGESDYYQAFAYLGNHLLPYRFPIRLNFTKHHEIEPSLQTIRITLL